MKRVLIIGASSGIGAAVAEVLARRIYLTPGHGVAEGSKGFDLILHGRESERLEAVVARCTLKGSSVKETGPEGPDSLEDVSTELILGDVVQWAEDVKSIPAIEPVDAVVWSAGICELAAGQMLGLKAIRRTLSVNLEAPLVVLSYFYRKGIIADGGTIVLLGSQSAHDAGEGFSVYAASKGGLASAARVLGKEFARKNIAVHCLEPGTVDTPMTKKLQAIFSGRGTKDEGRKTGTRLGDADFEMVSADEVATDVAALLFSSRFAKASQDKRRDPEARSG